MKYTLAGGENLGGSEGSFVELVSLAPCTHILSAVPTFGTNSVSGLGENLEALLPHGLPKTKSPLEDPRLCLPDSKAERGWEGDGATGCHNCPGRWTIVFVGPS